MLQLAIGDESEEDVAASQREVIANGVELERGTCRRQRVGEMYLKSATSWREVLDVDKESENNICHRRRVGEK